MTLYITYIDHWLNRGVQKIKAATEVETGALALFRIFFGLWMLLYFLPSWSWLSTVPPGFFTPRLLSIANLFSGHLPAFAYYAADILVIALFTMIILGIFTRLSLLLLFFISSVLYSFSYSFDKIDHHTTLLLFTFLCLIFTNIGTRHALRKDQIFAENTQKRALAILGIVIVFGMFTAGFPKLVHWVDLNMSTNGFLFWFYPGYFNLGNTHFLAPYVFKTPGVILELTDYFGAIFEVTGIFFLLGGRRYWISYLMIAAVFHLLCLWLLNIDFALNVLCYGIFIVSYFLQHQFKKIDIRWTKYRKLLVFIVCVLALIKAIQVFGVWNFTYYNSFFFKGIVNTLLILFTIFAAFFIVGRDVTTERKVGTRI